MPLTNCHYLPGRIWHITHRCHQQALLLQFKRDRRLWQRWLFEARRRYGLQVLNYMATRDHIHLLIRDRGEAEIPRAMSLIAGSTAQAFNGRKHRRGAFWEDCYHATAVESGEPLQRCLVYIDLNMVRAGEISDPADWDTCGYQEIQSPRTRYRIVDTNALMEALGIDDPQVLKKAHRRWVNKALWPPATGRRMEPASTGFCLRDEPLSYSARFDTETGLSD